MNDKDFSHSINLISVVRFAVGNDLIFIPDFQHSFNELFKNKVFLPGEQEYCERFDNALLRYASTFAAKEAVYKAMKQLDKAALPWKKIEIVRDRIAGQPSVIIHKPEVPEISLTVSHDGDYVWALAIIERIGR